MASNTPSSTSGRNHFWRFLRAGGMDQVRLERGADLRALGTLDQKLWAALSCPTRGLEFDSKTLDLIDTDKDGHIRAPEIIAASTWACDMLKNPDDLLEGSATLKLAAINDEHAEGKQLISSARQILKNLGKENAKAIHIDDTADPAKIFAHTQFNGDGIVPPGAADDESLQVLLKDIMNYFGSDPDRSGEPGVSQARAEQFFNEARAYAEWSALAEKDTTNILPLGDKTAAGAAALQSVKNKVDDFFARARLAAFDPRSVNALNRSEKEYELLAPKNFSASAAEVADFPLARVTGIATLPLRDGINPAWCNAVATLRDAVVQPLLGACDELTNAEWDNLCARFNAYDAWLTKKQGATVEPLGLARIRAILASDLEQRTLALIAQDKALEADANAIVAVDRLVHLHRDLHRLLNNFVALRDFYSGKSNAIFQAGTLYLDGRSCDLCIRIEDMVKHSAVATHSRTFLAYCECIRRSSGEKMIIAAAFTAGDSDQLMTGRNGIFYDRRGNDWDATIIKTVEHPISIRQAFWSPYKRIGRMIGEQIEKLASSRDKSMQDKASAGIAGTGQHIEAGKPLPFDVAKFAGIFAAIGLAIGAIGTVFASIVSGVLGLKWWQMPLAMGGLVLAISGPSMVIAAMKLRQRNLGPLLDANGWAVNTRAKINLVFGRTLTAVARLPPGSERSLEDPYVEKSAPWGWYTLLLALLLAAGILWQQGYIEKWLDLELQTQTEAPGLGQ